MRVNKYDYKTHHRCETTETQLQFIAARREDPNLYTVFREELYELVLSN